MPILFKCECGAPGMVPDEYAGKEYTCRTCGHTGVIPEVSAEDCVLVYHSGFPNEGMVLDRQEFWDGIAAGQYLPNDLIFHEGAWQPLRMVYEMPPQEGPQESPEPDIALQLSELPPMPGFDKQGSIHPMRIIRDFLHNSVEWMKRKRSTKHKTTRQKTVYYILVLIILIIGYFCGLGKVINFIRWRPAYVIVLNPDNEPYKAKLAGREMELPPNGRVVFQDIFVSVSSNKTLKVLKTTGELAYSVKVPIRPELDVLVSPGNKLEFDVFDMTKQKDVKLNGRLLQELAGEITQNKPPATLFKIENDLRECAKKVRTDTVQGQIFTSEAYSFTYCGMSRSMDYMEKQRARQEKEKEKKTPAPAPKPELVNATIPLVFGPCRFTYSPDVKKTTCSIVVDTGKPFLPVKPEELAKQKAGLVATPFKGRLTIDLSHDAKGSRTITSNTSLPAKTMVDKREFNGNWRYVPTVKPDAPAIWQWTWSYDGTHAPKFKNGKPQYLKINFTHGFDGKEKLVVK